VISQHTVAHHLRKVFSKREVTNGHQPAEALGDRLEAAALFRVTRSAGGNRAGSQT
jgi:hypothetical protein